MPRKDGIAHIGDYELEFMQLISPNKVVDISNMFLEFNLYEDILTPTMSCEITINDSLNLPLHLPLVGEEQISISFRTPTRKEINLLFDVYSLDSRRTVKQRQQIFTLVGISSAALHNQQTKVSKSFQNLQVSKIAELVFEEYLNVFDFDEIETEETNNSISCVIPNWSPITTMKWLASRAISTKNPGAANYLFWESTDFDNPNFHFRSIASLMAQETRHTLYYEPASTDPKKIPFNKISDFLWKDNYNMLENIGKGMYGSSLISVDLVNKKFTTTDFNYNRDFPKVPHLYNNPMITKADVGALEEPLGNHKQSFIARSAKNDSGNPEDYLLQRKSQLQELNNTRLIIQLSGNTDIKVGHIVTFEIPSTEPQDDTEKQSIDNHYSGRFLVSSIKHKLKTTEHNMVIELIKDSFAESLIETKDQIAQSQKVLSPQNFNTFFK